MKRNAVVILLALALLFLAACGDSDYRREVEEKELQHEIDLEEAYERGYNDAEDEYTFQIEELQSALGKAEEMAMHLSNMLDAPDDFTWDDVYDAVEELYTHLQNSR